MSIEFATVVERLTFNNPLASTEAEDNEDVNDA
jgi:hypothetical protein